jgi:hypothetical protein
MRYLLYLISLFAAADLKAQYVYTIKADSVKITSCDSAELILENHTQNVPGFLFNTGNGRTIFKRGAQPLGNGAYLIGADTLQTTSNAWVQGGNAFGATGVLGTTDSNHVDLYTNNTFRARLTAAGNMLLGTNTDNGQLFQVNGSSYFNGTQHLTGNFNEGLNQPHFLYDPTVNAYPGDWEYNFGYRLLPTMVMNGNYQESYPVDITPTFNLNGYAQYTDGISAALHIGTTLGGIRIDQNQSYPGDTGEPLFIYQGGSSDKAAILNYRNGNATGTPFIWHLDGRPASTSGLIVPAIESTVSSPQAGGGISFTMDRFYWGTEASIQMIYQTTPDTGSNVNTSIVFNTTSSTLGRLTPMYINGGNVGLGTNSPTAQLHATGSVRFAGLTQDSTQTNVLVSDANGNLYYRSASSLATDDPVRSSLAVNGTIRSRKIIVSPDEWADYVFDSAYQLPRLTDVESYIHRQHHLPGIPSAAAVQRDSLDVGANQAALLKKIEELTLYTIDQDKKLNTQDQQLATLKSELEELKSLINQKNKVAP